MQVLYCAIWRNYGTPGTSPEIAVVEARMAVIEARIAVVQARIAVVEDVWQW